MKRILLSMMLVLSMLVAGCGVKVESINKKPQKYAGKTVKLSGIVKKVVSVPPQENMPGITLYQMTDTPGGGDETLIWVIRGQESSQKALPNPNHRLTLEGVVEAERKIRNMTYAPVIIEKTAQEEIPADAPASFG